MGRVTWAAFKCGALAAQMKDPKEHDRLFALGCEQGKAFTGTAQTTKIEHKYVSKEVPSLSLHVETHRATRFYSSARVNTPPPTIEACEPRKCDRRHTGLQVRSVCENIVAKAAALGAN